MELLDCAVEGLCLFYDLRVRYAEGESACWKAAERLESLALSGSRLQTRAKILTWASFFNRQLGNQDQALKLLRESQIIIDQALADGHDTRREQANLLLQRGNIDYNRDLEAAQRYYRQSLKLYQELNDDWQMAKTISSLAGSLTRGGDYDQALDLFPECIALHRQIGNLRGLASALRMFSLAHVRTGRLDRALTLMQDAVGIYRSIGDQTNTAGALSGLGLVFAWHGRFAEAIDLSHQSLGYYQDLGDHYQIAFNNLFLGTVNALSGQYKNALEHTQTGYLMARKHRYRRELAVSYLVFGWLDLVERAYTKAFDTLQESVSNYRKVSHLDELGWALGCLGHACHGLGKSLAAEGYLCEALRIGLHIRGALTAGFTLPAIALFSADQGKPDRAVELYALASRIPAVANSKWFDDIYGDHINNIAESLPFDVAAAARTRGAECDLWETATELLQEFCGK
jgi:tetratricopeptide (TPR) repeat protein